MARQGRYIPHMFSPTMFSPPLLRTAALLGTLAAAGCSGDVSPLRSIGIAGSAPKGPEAPDFVANSRSQAGTEYLPVGVSAPPRPVRAKSTESQKALEAELEGARSRNLARGRAAESAGQGTGKDAGKSANPAPAQ